MKMKRNIFYAWQTRGLRLVVCTIALTLSATGAYAQSIDEEELTETTAKPKRPVVDVVSYPTVNMKGIVTDQATGAPLAGVQLQVLGHPRYTSMTDEDGTFNIKVPVFTTTLYVHTPQYIAQQVAVNANDTTKRIAVKMLSDKFLPMYDMGTEYTASKTTKIDRFGVTVENEIASELGADVRSIQRSGAVANGNSMFIRGLNSITGNSQPLIVIDGIEQDMQLNRGSLHQGFFNNILANISPDDIEKVTVLKNATALYGARGANGVILIETKRGHSMATRIDANISVGVQMVPRLPSMMDASQYRTYVTELMGTDQMQSTITQLLKQQNLQKLDFKFLNDDPNGYYYNTYHNNTDWQDEVYRNAMTQNYSINVQGGDEIGMYNLSVGYIVSDNTIKETSFDRMNVRFNTDISIVDKLKTRFDISISRTNATTFDDGFSANLASSTITSPGALALVKSPLVYPYQYSKQVGGFTSLLSDYDEIFSSLGNGYSLANPVCFFENASGDNKNKVENTYFNVHVAPIYDITSEIQAMAEFSYTLDRNSQRYFRPNQGVPPFEVEELGTVNSMVASMFAKEQNFVGRGQVSWKHLFDGVHDVKAFVGGSYNYFSYDNSDLSTEYQTRQNDKNPGISMSDYPTIQGVNDVWKNIKWYGNVDYNFMNRYFATLSLTAEANSRFGESADGLNLFGTRWALFPSVQLGWVMTNESWFPKNVGINYLRVNAGYDVSGNDDISNYAARTSYTAVKFNGDLTGIQLTNIGNDKIQWETTKKMNVGLQGYFLNNRVGVNFDYYIHKTDNLLMLKSFSNPIGGINRYWSNGGSLENQGFETTITVKPVVLKDWSVEVGASIGHYSNKVTKLTDGDYTSSIYGDNNIITSEGNPVALFYGYRTAGVFADDASAKAAGNGGYLYMEDNAGQRYDFKAGDIHFVDLNGDGKISDADKTIIGDPNPDIYGNLFATVNWKNLTLALNFNYSLGNDVFNYQRSILNAGSNFQNQQVAEVGRWRYEGQQASLPKANYGDPMGNNRFSDRWIEDGSYLRLKRVNLSYRVPVPATWDWLQGLTVWAEAQNLLTFTKYLGSDPEFSIGNSVFYQGIDRGNIALGRNFTMGVKINL